MLCSDAEVCCAFVPSGRMTGSQGYSFTAPQQNTGPGFCMSDAAAAASHQSDFLCANQ